MPHVYSLREVRVITSHGDSVIVEARKPKEITSRLLSDCISAGCVECDENGKIMLSDVPPPKVAADDIPFLSVEERADTDKRRKVIRMALLHLYKVNDKADFKADGLPRNGSVEKLVRFPVSNAEVTDILEQLENS
jgi:hypothetical protein